MSAHQLPYQSLVAPGQIADPGASGAIVVGANGNGFCSIKTAAAETRTLGAPSAAGQRLLISMETDGGDCVITVTGGQGFTTITLNDAGDAVLLAAISVAGTAKWKAIANPDSVTS